MSARGIKRKATSSRKKEASFVKRRKSEQISLEKPKTEQGVVDKIEDKMEDENHNELLAFISALLVQQKITKTRLVLNVVEAKNNWLKLAARRFCFEVWWHKNKREGLRETMIHRVLRDLKIPNLMVADLDFALNDINYLLRRIRYVEISLSDYIQNFDAKINLTIKHIKYGVQSLDNLQCALYPSRDLRVTHAGLFTNYTAANTIMIVTKNQIEFHYKVTDECDMIISTEDKLGKQLYYRGLEKTSRSYPVFESMAIAAERIGASAQLAQLIRGIPSGRSKIVDVMNCDGEQPLAVPRVRTYAERPEFKQLEPIAFTDKVLQDITAEVVKHITLSERPIFTVKQHQKWQHHLEDQNGNCFEIVWCDNKDQARITTMVHKIMREAKVPHLLTANFGFEYNDYYVIVRQYDPKCLIPLSSSISTAHYQPILERVPTMTLKDVLNGVQQMAELFDRVLVPLDELCESRPVALTSRSFGGYNLWILPDDKGGYDFKYLINWSCGAMKLVDDGVGVAVYTNRYIDEPSFGVFGALGDVAEDLGYDDLFYVIRSLNPNDKETFAKEVAEVTNLLFTCLCTLQCELNPAVIMFSNSLDECSKILIPNAISHYIFH